MPKQPQDHQKKKDAVDRLRDEAASLPEMEDLAGLVIEVSGKQGKARVTLLDSPLDWDAGVPQYLRDSDYLEAICGMCSDSEAAKVRAVRPTIGDMLRALMEPIEETG